MRQSTSINQDERRRTRAPAGYTAEAEVADQLDVKIGTLRTWASRGNGPPVRVSVGRRVFYRTEALAAWLRAKEQGNAATPPAETRQEAETTAPQQPRRALAGAAWGLE